ncbi:MAG: hypothetical protein ACR2N1_06690 [Rubripirellula sp.]
MGCIFRRRGGGLPRLRYSPTTLGCCGQERFSLIAGILAGCNSGLLQLRVSATLGQYNLGSDRFWG